MAISIGLNTAVRALLAQQQAMDAVSHNVANVNTPGYSRQRVLLAPAPPAGSSGVGGGVQMLGVQRIRDLFVDFQLRSESQAAGEFAARAESLRMAELAFGEPGEGGLSAVMDAFFNSWRDLANTPEQSAARSAVVQAGETLAFAANRLNRSLNDIRENANIQVESAVREVNNLAQTVAALNGKIVSVRATGDPASDLSDERDLALDRLAELVDMRFIEMDDGRVDVFLGGRALVNATTAATIDAVRNPGNLNFFELQWSSDGSAVPVNSGRIGGLIDQRDVDLPARLADLDTLVGQIITDVNAVHAAGFALDGVTTGQAFFTGTDAATIGVDAAVRGNLGLLAAATLGSAVGDGSNALAIADLQAATNLTGNSETYGAFYNGIVTRLGVSVRDVEGLARSQRLTIQHLNQMKLSTSGVNLDEEMVNLVQFQRGYEAAARLIRAIDEMLDTLINRTGR
jgi:flagellar hook-associated protein 1 FlgK